MTANRTYRTLTAVICLTLVLASCAPASTESVIATSVAQTVAGQETEEMAGGQDGTVRPARRSLTAPVLSRGLLPPEGARLSGTVCEGERKNAVVEITPVRFSTSRRELVLAGRVVVKLAFTGVAGGESPGGELLVELRHHFRSDLKAAGANPGTNGNPEVGWFAAEQALYRCDCLGEDAGTRPAPAGMDRCYGLGRWIGNENRETIRDLHRQGGAC